MKWSRKRKKSTEGCSFYVSFASVLSQGWSTVVGTKGILLVRWKKRDSWLEELSEFRRREWREKVEGSIWQKNLLSVLSLFVRDFQGFTNLCEKRPSLLISVIANKKALESSKADYAFSGRRVWNGHALAIYFSPDILSSKLLRWFWLNFVLECSLRVTTLIWFLTRAVHEADI